MSITSDFTAGNLATELTKKTFYTDPVPEPGPQPGDEDSTTIKNVAKSGRTQQPRSLKSSWQKLFHFFKPISR